MLDKLTSWWRDSYCAERIRALGFWPWVFMAGAMFNATLGKHYVLPLFGEEEAEIVGVYQTLGNNQKPGLIYRSDGTWGYDSELFGVLGKWFVNREG